MLMHTQLITIPFFSRNGFCSPVPKSVRHFHFSTVKAEATVTSPVIAGAIAMIPNNFIELLANMGFQVYFSC